MRLSFALRAAWRYFRHRIAPHHPSTCGAANLTLSGIDAAVEILFDAYGVPHIQADSEPDMFFGLGYMHGRDRRFQMEIMRAMAEGSLRDLFGAGDLSTQIVEQEVLCRTLGFKKKATQYLEEASAEDLALLRSYCSGVNAATDLEPLPIEFQLLDIKPKPWAWEVPIALAQMFAFGLSKNWEMELARLEIALYQRMKGQAFESAFLIWPTNFDFPPHLIERGEVDAGPSPPRPDACKPLPPELAAYLEEFPRLYELPGMTDGQRQTEQTAATMADISFPQGGSNNWAIHGSQTRNGCGALAADPHLPLSLPSPGYLAHLQCRAGNGTGYKLIGAGLIGIPGIFFGSNGQVAWGMTANWTDVTDLFVEKTNPSNPGCYEYEGKYFPFDLTEETFQIRSENGFGSDTRHIRRSRHGPLLNDVLSRLPAGFPLVSLKTAERIGQPLTSLRNLYMARSSKQAATALSTMDLIVGHWALADRDGDIAYQASGSVPRRMTHRGTFPAAGYRKKKYTWDGWVAGADLPCLHNPLNGLVVTANNQVVAPDAGDFVIDDEGDVAYRAIRLKNVFLSNLDRMGAISPIQFSRDMHLDNVELLFADILPIWKSALESMCHEAEGDVAEAARQLLAWDGSCAPESVPAALFQGVCMRLFHTNLRNEIPSDLLGFVNGYFNAEPLVYVVLTTRNLPEWNSDERIKECLRSTVKQFRVHYGPNIQEWRWRIIAPFTLKHPFGGHPLFRRFFNRGPLPTSGAHNALNKQYTSRLDDNRFPVMVAAALRINIDLGDLPGSMMCVLGGQSGRPGSPHYDDQIANYIKGIGVSMEMDFEVIRRNAAGSLVLFPRCGTE